MRYNTVDDIIFTDHNGINYTVKDRRELTEFENALTVKNEEDLYLDELISRDAFLGEGAEDLLWAVADHNAEKLTENNFILSKLNLIKMPVIENI